MAKNFFSKPESQVDAEASKIQTVQKVFDESLNDLVEHKAQFVNDPNRDFTRSRKLTFIIMILNLIRMASKSMQCELTDFFLSCGDAPSMAAFVKRREKIMYTGLIYLLRLFAGKLSEAGLAAKTFKGFLLLGVDGSKSQIDDNRDDKPSRINPDKNRMAGHNEIHINAMYDLLNHLYIDVILQPVREANERTALIAMAERLADPQKCIITADRGYESWNLLAHLDKCGAKYVIRAKTPDSNGIISGFHLPEYKEFDKTVTRRITRSQKAEYKSQKNLYRCIANYTVFDLLGENTESYYEITLRIVCIKLNDSDSYEYLLTNLSPSEFLSDDLKKIYHLRWEIETSFRFLKHTFCLNNYHCRKREHNYQEVAARMIMYNYCSAVNECVETEQKAENKYRYRNNFSNAITACRMLLERRADFIDIVMNISRHKVPIRENRRYSREKRNREVPDHNNRIA